MKVTIKETRGTYKDIYRATLNTIGKDTNNEPTDTWKRRLLMSEHSPIRKLSYGALFEDLKYWVSVHLTRHKFGIEHFVSTQREDRTGFGRNAKPQDAPVRHEIDANAQAIINISRKRLCTCASPETRQAWKEFLEELKKVDNILPTVCVKECVYRNGLCAEFKTCGYNKTPAFEKELAEYIKGMEGQVNDKTNVNLH